MRIKILAKNISASRISINRSNELAIFLEGDLIDIEKNIKKIFDNTDLEFKISNENPIAIRTSLKSESIGNNVLETISILKTV